VVNNRRHLLQLAIASGLGLSNGVLSGCSSTGSQFLRQIGGESPFALGVASGSPTSSSVVLWTRLALALGSKQAIPNERVAVTWELAFDDQFKNIAAKGVADALPELGHSIHVEPSNLKSNRPYWYRFRIGDALSPVGRTLTAPAANETVARLRVVMGSCQHWEQGYFHAWKHAVDENPDLIVFTGDYIYEYGPSADKTHPRFHNSNEVKDLAGYRARYALYKSDPDLQAAHAAAPWLVTWDDHEVSNDYANDRDERGNPDFLERRSAAYQAYWEHMPLSPKVFDRALLPSMQIYKRYGWGRLAQFHMLDDRQYRDHQACPHNKGGASTVWRDQCAALDDPTRSLLGAKQEAWLSEGLLNDSAQWTLIGQQTLMAQMNQAMDQELGSGRERYWTDGWNGYQPARERFLQTIKRAQANQKSRNPLVLGGDVHAWYLSDLQLQSEVKTVGQKAPIIATEICGTSITSRSWPQEVVEKLMKLHPHIKVARSDKRGYTLIDVDSNQATIRLRAMDDVRRADSKIATLSTVNVLQGRPGIQS
jgi:alkaline phosphatase D